MVLSTLMVQQQRDMHECSMRAGSTMVAWSGCVLQRHHQLVSAKTVPKQEAMATHRRRVEGQLIRFDPDQSPAAAAVPGGDSLVVLSAPHLSPLPPLPLPWPRGEGGVRGARECVGRGAGNMEQANGAGMEHGA